MSGAEGVALVFPGQGSQVPGMAAAWRGQPAWKRWAEADDLLRHDVTRLGLDAGADELRRPWNCQVALFVHHIVLLESWLDAGHAQPAATAGHSLGEYDALVAAGVLGFADALALVEARARHTQAAADANPGTMVACVGFPPGTVEEACRTARAHVANDNAPGQIVVAGSNAVLAALRERLDDAGGRVLDLNVGAAYHSPHMEPAVAPLGHALDATAFSDAAVPVVANVDAASHTSAGEWPELLRRQVTRPVRWRESVETMARGGLTEVVELGASPVLTGMVKRIDRTLTRRTVTSPEDL